jgi:hypothetical protein
MDNTNKIKKENGIIFDFWKTVIFIGVNRILEEGFRYRFISGI